MIGLVRQLVAAAAVVVAALLASSFGASEQAFAQNGRVMTCTFSAGQVNTFENGAFRSEKTSVLTFEIGDIDLDRQTAALITARGKGELRVVRAINANHFLEVVTEGFLNITTIYDVGGDALPAVHSRHLGLLGQPVTAQYQGICRVKS